MSDKTTEYMSLPVKTAQFVSDEVLRLRAENAALRAAVERVRALHVGKQAFYPNWDGAVICQTCNTLSPCPTLRALEGTP